MTKFAPFDAADYLTDEETIAAYLSAALEDPDPDLFLVAVRDVARARGMTQLARATGLGRADGPSRHVHHGQSPSAPRPSRAMRRASSPLCPTHLAMEPAGVRRATMASASG